ncbi:hypothetical protein MR829_23370 [Paracoccus versutus]|uniref:hypothetical protein n=1 Tax=Paracoccus versutus TaxID=34007 RepID=UPI001FB755CD|nr:hypothetical protein [Paracoccus versutus]MCJ1903262.1 hypothetical protein [Paracoccus versutus]
MIQTTRILPGIVHEISFQYPSSSLQLMDVMAEDIFFFAGLKSSDGPIILNNRINNAWGSEETVIVPPDGSARRLSLWFKFNGSEIELWNDHVSHVFRRFNGECAAQTGLSRLQGVENPGRSLAFRVMTPEAMAAEIGYQVLNRRIDRLEAAGISAASSLTAEPRANSNASVSVLTSPNR